MKKCIFSCFLFCFCSLYLNAQFTDSMIAVKYDHYLSLLDSSKAEGINGIILSNGGSTFEMKPHSKFKAIEYILYSGNDWDYDTRKFPDSWFKFKNLKAILIANVTYESELTKNSKQQKSSIFIGSMSECNTVWHSLSLDSVRDKKYNVKFIRNPKIPYEPEINLLANKSEFSFDDSMDIFSIFIANELQILNLKNTFYNHDLVWRRIDSTKFYRIRNSMRQVFGDSFLMNIKQPEILNNAFKPDFLDSSGYNYFINYLEKSNQFAYLDAHFKYSIDLLLDHLYEFNSILNPTDRESACQFYYFLYNKSLSGYFGSETFKKMNELKKLACP